MGQREAEARGASVRNFGLIWVSGRKPGAELALALRARELWEEIAAVAPGTGFRPAGSVTLAADETELRLLKEASVLPDARPGGTRTAPLPVRGCRAGAGAAAARPARRRRADRRGHP